MEKAKILNTCLTHFKIREIIDIYSEEEVLESNINESEKDFINESKGKFVGYCLSGYPNDDGTIDYTGLYEEDVEWINASK